MHGPSLESAAKDLAVLFQDGVAAYWTDGECLERYLAARDRATAEAAFRVLVERHAGMVIGLSRRIVGDVHEAEDVAQAVFFVLARNARSIRNKDAVASWLFGTAHRIALRAAKVAARRRSHERVVRTIGAQTEHESFMNAKLSELEDAIGRLTTKHRAPLVLCELEGLSQEQAAARLNWSVRTVQRRLTEAKDRLRRRLRGQEWSPAIALPLRAGINTISSAWIDATSKAALDFAAGAKAGAVAAGLANHTIRRMTMARVRTALGIMLLVGGIAAGVIPLARAQKPAQPPLGPAVEKKSDDTSPKIAVTVIDAKTKKPLQDVELRTNIKPEYKTDANGKSTVPIVKPDGNSFSIWFTKPGYVPTRAIWTNSKDPVIPSSYTLELSPGTTIGGKVVDVDGRPIVGAKAYLLLPTDNGRTSRTVPYIWDETVKTGADGTWRYDQMPEKFQGLWVRYEHEAFLSDAGRSDAPPMDKLQDRSLVRVMTKGFPVSGTVVDAQGKPIAGASVAQGSSRASNYPVTKTDGDGKFRFGNASKGPMILTVQAAGHAPELVTVDVDPGIAPVAIKLEPAATIRGRVVDTNDKPIANAWVTVDTWRGNRMLSMKTETDDDGRFRLEDAPADTVELQASKPGFMNSPSNPAIASGAEVTIRLSPPLKISGKVLDAETGKPIPQFSLVPGDPSRAPASWERDRVRTLRDGRYEISFTWPYPSSRILRVEADGYLPADSPAYAVVGGGDQTHDFLLKKGAAPVRKAVTGVLLKPDGKPAGGVTLYLATQERGVNVSNGVVHEGTEAGSPVKKTRTTSREDGSFAFPPQEHYGIVVVADDLGFATARESDLAESNTIKLLPWGRIVGEVRSGSKPVKRGEVSLYSASSNEADLRMVHITGRAIADDEGKFTIDRVVPGKQAMGRRIALSESLVGNQSNVSVDIPPGETVRVTIGGGGRTIVGRAVIPEDTRLPAVWGVGSSDFSLKAPPYYEPPNMNKEERKIWYSTWSQTPAGQAYLAWQRDRRFYAVKFDKDGNFRIEDVKPGTYDLHVRPMQGEAKRVPVATAIVTVVVPELADGDLEKPLDLGDISLKPLAK